MRYIEIEARNAFFNQDSENLFKELTERAQNNHVKKYINTNLKRYFINDWEPNNNRYLIPVHQATNNDPKWLQDAVAQRKELYEINIPQSKKATLIHIVDYLNTLPPKPISIPVKDLQFKIKQWDKELKNQKLLDTEDGIELLHDYKNGFKWVKVFGKESLNREGSIMNHCVGGYYNEVKENNCEIYSLRDDKNIPHVTIEYRKSVIVQIKGNSNQPPKDEYLKYVNDLLQHRYIPYKDIEQSDLISCGLIFSDKKVYRIKDAPEGLVIKGDLDLRDCKDIDLPKGLVIEGYLDISESEIFKLPERLHVKGDFYAENSHLTQIPDSCVFDRNISIERSNVYSWHIQKINGDFNASYTDIDSLPDNMEVFGDCNLSCTSLSYIDTLTVHGYLDLSGCRYLDSDSIGLVTEGGVKLTPLDIRYKLQSRN